MKGRICDNTAMNVYDDETFFSSYIALREGVNYNDLLETPAMLSLLGSVEGKDILDLGCGTGFTTAELERRYPATPVRAVDISAGMVAEAERLSRFFWSPDRTSNRTAPRPTCRACPRR